jgi:AcrR family transcriptional regulator
VGNAIPGTGRETGTATAVADRSAGSVGSDGSAGSAASDGSAGHVGSAARVEHAVAARTLQGRSEAYAEEIRRFLDATYAVMRRTGDVDPRVSDIVREAGLSNQAFYRHFRGKDELLVAVLADGQRQLVETLDARMHAVPPGTDRVRAWVEVVMAQARRPAAAANTRPFAINGLRLADRYPHEWSASRDELLAPLRVALADAGGDPDDASLVYQLVMGTMQHALVRRETPTDDDVERVGRAVLRLTGNDGNGS